VRHEHGGDDLTTGREQVDLSRVGAEPVQEAEQRVGGVRVAEAAHGGDDDHDGAAAREGVAHARAQGGAALRGRDRRAAELLDDDRAS